MAESDGIKEVVKQATIQAETAVMQALRDVEAEPQLTTVVSHSRAQWDWPQGAFLHNPGDEDWEDSSCMTISTYGPQQYWQISTCGSK